MVLHTNMKVTVSPYIHILLPKVQNPLKQLPHLISHKTPLKYEIHLNATIWNFSIYITHTFLRHQTKIWNLQNLAHKFGSQICTAVSFTLFLEGPYRKALNLKKVKISFVYNMPCT